MLASIIDLRRSAQVPAAFLLPVSRVDVVDLRVAAPPTARSPERFRGLPPVAAPAPAPVETDGLDRTLRTTIEAALSKILDEAARLGESYINIAEACRKFAISRTTFYELLPAAEAAGVAVRVPPPTGSVRIPVRRFEAWLVEAMKGKQPRKRGAKGRV